MGVDGSPLQVHGQVRAAMVVQGHTLGMEALVVSPLTIEGILGLDFLKEHEATIDVKSKEPLLRTRGCTLPLMEANTPCRTQPTVHIVAIVSIPPNSEVEVMACLSEPVESGTWLLEELPGKRHAACIARAVGTP